jgi:hypothetical protein
MRLFVIIKTSAKVDLPIITVPLKQKPKNYEVLLYDIKSTFTFASATMANLFFKDRPILPVTDMRLLWKEIKHSPTCSLVFECDLTPEALKKIETREMACMEFIQTEKYFLSNLEILQSYWQKEFLKSQILESKKLHPAALTNLKNLFTDLPKISTPHMLFLTNLVQNPITYYGLFGPRFLNSCEGFLGAKAFISNYNTRTQALQTQMKISAVAKKMNDIQSRAPDGRDFFSIYITVVQRYPRYVLLLKEIDKNTMAFHPDKPYLAEAGIKSVIITRELDQMSRRVKYAQIFHHLCELMSDFPNYHMKGELLLELLNSNKEQKLCCFNDYIVLEGTTKYSKPQVSFLAKLERLSFTLSVPTPESISFFPKAQPFIFRFASIEDKLQFFNCYLHQLNNLFTLRDIKKKIFNGLQSKQAVVSLRSLGMQVVIFRRQLSFMGRISLSYTILKKNHGPFKVFLFLIWLVIHSAQFKVKFLFPLELPMEFPLAQILSFSLEFETPYFRNGLLSLLTNLLHQEPSIHVCHMTTKFGFLEARSTEFFQTSLLPLLLPILLKVFQNKMVHLPLVYIMLQH